MNLRLICLILALAAITAHADELQTLVTIKGERFEKAHVTEVTPATITIVHAAGVATVPLTDFSPEIQKQFGYDEAKAKAWLDQIAEQQRQAIAAAAAAEKDAQRAKNAQASARKAKDLQFEAELHRMQSMANAFYDPATRRWYRSQDEAANARTRALNDALDARHYQKP